LLSSTWGAPQAARKEASKKWFESISARVADLAQMTSQQADDLLRALCSPPVYFCHEPSVRKLVTLRKKVESHLENKGVEWLYERYQQLSPAAQKAFLSLLKMR